MKVRFDVLYIKTHFFLDIEKSVANNPLCY